MTRHLLPLFALAACLSMAHAEDADLILHNGKIVTVDRKFTIHKAIAVRGNRILKVGSDADVMKTKGDATKVIDLAGNMVIPGLIDSHVHPTSASMTEFDHEIPVMESIDDVLNYIKGRAQKVPEGEWISLSQVFITRLKEQRYPTREELDRVAPRNPVVFATGPDASLNTLALKASKIDKDFKITDGGPGYIEKDKNGEPTGILRSCTRFVRSQGGSGRKATELDRTERLLQLFKDYNSVGLTAIADRDAGRGDIGRYEKLRENQKLTLRIAASQHVGTIGDIDAVKRTIQKIAADPLCKKDPWLRIVGIKTYLDGGMLTGSAYMREPWGLSKIYSINDPKYQGLLFIPRERLLPIVQTTLESNLQFTAHSVGDGAVHTLLDVYGEINEKMPVAKQRPCITHSNFMSKEAVEKAAKLGVVVDIQPAWLYLDTRTLVAQFGNDRLRYFQPLKSIFEAGGIAGGGSDHMQKIGSFRAVNPYNPFLGMATTVTRRARWFEGRLHPEEALTREQAIRFYTSNNAYILFLEDQIGSLEEGKLADLIVLDTDLLTCPEEDMQKTQVLRTYVDGKLVYEKKEPQKHTGKPASDWELPALLSAKPLKEDRADDELRRLLTARYNEAVSEAREYYVIRKKAGGDFEQAQHEFYRMWRRVLDAGLDVNDRPAEKVALLGQYVEVMKGLEKIEAARVDAGRNPISLLHRARYERLDAEVRLLRAKREADRTKDK